MKIEKKEINKRTLVIGGIVLAIVLIAAIMIAEGVSGMKKKKTDVSEGLKIIEQAESADVTAIETKIGQLEAKDSQGQEDTRSLKEIFGSTVVMGDSISEGFAEFDVLNTSSVISKIGVELDELDEQVEQLVKVNPQVVFLTFGANDILATKGDKKAYIEQYKVLIEKIRKKLPETKIFINSIFPVQKWRVEEEPLFEHIAEYNEALRAMCDKLQIAYVDNTELVTDRYYEADGMHFKSDFYPVWARRMAEFSAL